MSFRLTRPAESFYLLLLIFRDTYPLQLSTCHALRKIFNELFTTSAGARRRRQAYALDRVAILICIHLQAYMWYMI